MEARVQSLRHTRGQLSAAVLDGSLDASGFPLAYSSAADQWLSRHFDEAAPDIGGFALLAVGGYGRQELCPGSDLDLVLLHHPRRKPTQLAETIWYSIWDSGTKLDHSVRTPKEAVALAREDRRSLLGLLDGRVVAGDAALATPVLAEVAAHWRAHPDRWLPELSASRRQRLEHFGELPFLLEPDLKQSVGGLRDLELLTLAARALPALEQVLLPAGMAAHRRLLLSVRVVLHARTGGDGDRLLLQEQDEVARLFGMLDADQLMGRLAEAGREVMWAAEDGWRRVASYLAGPLGRGGGRDVPVRPGVMIRDGEVALAAGASPRANPALLADVAAAASEYRMPISAGTLDRFVGELTEVVQPWGRELREAWLSLLEFGEAAIGVLEVMDQRRLLELLIPEWTAVRHRPQRNAYHRFTVDRHLLEAVAEAAKLLRRVSRPDLLLVGALLHDIGKGYPGDHSREGRVVAATVARRMGYGENDVAVIERLVELHLLLADTATRRDLEDPAAVSAVADAVGDRQTLELLAALTEADSLATGVTAWSPWKASLVADLVSRVDAVLSGGPKVMRDASGRPPLPTPHQLELAARGELIVTFEDGVVTVIAPDRPGCLSVVAGTLALHRLDIRTARAMDDSRSMAIEVFEVVDEGGRSIDAGKLRDDIEAALDGRLLLGARLANLEAAYARGRRPTVATEPLVSVLLDDLASSFATVVEVRAPDSRGLLHRLTGVLLEEGLDVVWARVATIGHEVVDTFYVRQASTGRRLPSHHHRDLEDRLRAAAESRRDGAMTAKSEAQHHP